MRSPCFPTGAGRCCPFIFMCVKRSGSISPRPSKERSPPNIPSGGRTRAAWRTTSASTATPRTCASRTTKARGPRLPRTSRLHASRVTAPVANTLILRTRPTSQNPRRRTSPRARAVTGRGNRCGRCSMSTTRSICAATTTKPTIRSSSRCPGAAPRTTSSPMGARRRRASNTRRCCNRPVIARAARPA